MKHIEKPANDECFVRENHEALIVLSQNVVNVLDEKAEQTDFVDQCWQVVVQKQCSLHEKVR